MLLLEELCVPTSFLDLLILSASFCSISSSASSI